MKKRKEKDGIPMSQQVERAILEFNKKFGR